MFTGIFAVSTILKKVAPMAEEAFKDAVSLFMTGSSLAHTKSVQELHYFCC